MSLKFMTWKFIQKKQLLKINIILLQAARAPLCLNTNSNHNNNHRCLHIQSSGLACDQLPLFPPYYRSGNRDSGPLRNLPQFIHKSNNLESWYSQGAVFYARACALDYLAILSILNNRFFQPVVKTALMKPVLTQHRQKQYIYTYICIYIHTHTHIYIYTYISLF